jgi:hypothetical protein
MMVNRSAIQKVKLSTPYYTFGGEKNNMSKINLKVAYTPNGEFLHIVDYTDNVQALCPFCKRPLIAKRGNIKRPHYAHRHGETCRESRSSKILPTIPLYHTFDLFGLKPMQRQTIGNLYHCFGDRWFVKRGGQLSAEGILKGKTHKSLKQLTNRKVLDKAYKQDEIGFSWMFRLSSQARILFGDIPLAEFWQIYECQVKPGFNGTKTENELFSDYVTYLQQTTLYCYRGEPKEMAQQGRTSLDPDLQIGPRTFWKIGITSRDPDIRKKEIQLAVRPFLGTVALTEEILAPGAGILEQYIFLRWAQYRQSVGKMTEFFTESFPIRKFLAEVGALTCQN